VASDLRENKDYDKLKGLQWWLQDLIGEKMKIKGNYGKN
jgi:hypothetical protein